MISSKTRSIRLPTGLTAGSAIAINPTMVMVVLLIFMDPWHTLLAVAVGLPTYSLTVLLTLLLIAFQYARGEGEFSALREKSFYFFVLVIIGLIALMLVRFSPVVGVRQIFGSVIVPLGLGILIALVKDRNNLGYYIGGALLFKLVLLVPLVDAYLQAYPKRPMLYGEAIYLLFGVGLDALVGMLIAAVSATRGRLRAVACLLLPVAAFNLVGMNSRGLIVSSLFIGLLAVCFDKAQRRTAALAFLGYVTSVLSALLLLPGRAAHLEALLKTLLSQLSVGSYQSSVDGSTAIRMDFVRQILHYGSFDAFGHSLATGDADLLASHFFPLILEYGTGYVGLALFVIMWAGVAFRALKLTKCPNAAIKFTGLFGLATVLQVGYFGVLLNSQVVFLLFGFFLALPSVRNDATYPRDGLTHGDARKVTSLLPGDCSFRKYSRSR